MLTVVSTIVLAFILINIWTIDNGIIALDGWADGVAFCDGGPDVPRHIIQGGTQWRTAGVTYIINDGHMKDTQVEEIQLVAPALCVQLTN